MNPVCARKEAIDPRSSTRSTVNQRSSSTTTIARKALTFKATPLSNPFLRVPSQVITQKLSILLSDRDIMNFKVAFRSSSTLISASTVIRTYALEPLIQTYLYLDCAALDEIEKTKALSRLMSLAKALNKNEKLPPPSYKNLRVFFEIIEARNLIRMVARLAKKLLPPEFAKQDSSILKKGALEKAKALREWIEKNKKILEQYDGFLDLNHCNMTLLPKETFYLKALKGLLLKKNFLVFLPKEIKELKGLELLYLNNNRLTFLPNEIAELYALEQLCLDNNRIAHLPDELCNLRILKDFFYDGNALIDLSAFFYKDLLVSKLSLKKFLKDRFKKQNKKAQLNTILDRMILCLKRGHDKKTLSCLLGKIDMFVGSHIRKKLYTCFFDVCNRAFHKKSQRQRLKRSGFAEDAFLDLINIDVKLKVAAIELLKKTLKRDK